MSASSAGQELTAADEEAVVPILDTFEPGEPFHFDHYRFYIPHWMPERIADMLDRRLRARAGRITDDPALANVLFTWHGCSRAEKAAYTSCGDDQVVAGPEWLVRAYFGNEAFWPPVHVAFPTAPNVAVWPDMEAGMKRHIKVALECEGAIVVPSAAEAELCFVPNDHPFLTNPPEYLPHVRFVGLKEMWRMLETAKAKDKGAAIHHGQKPARRERHVPEPILAPALRTANKRTPFTAEDRDWLARYLAYMNPGEAGRTSRLIYDNLGEDDPPFVLHWASRHTPEAWREHYRRNRSKPWQDGTILDDNIAYYVRNGIDGSLRTKKEREVSRAKGKGWAVRHSQRRVTFQDEDDEHDEHGHRLGISFQLRPTRRRPRRAPVESRDDEDAVENEAGNEESPPESPPQNPRRRGIKSSNRVRNEQAPRRRTRTALADRTQAEEADEYESEEGAPARLPPSASPQPTPSGSAQQTPSSHIIDGLT